ncbi:MAG: hypothetical protein AAGD18_03450 [Actinomycetota bacterium]
MSHLPQPDVLVDGILHPGERDRFVAMCVPTGLDEVPGLRARIVGHLGHVESLVDGPNLVDGDAARALAAALLSALDDAPTLDGDRRALLRGAIEYFVDQSDSIDDVDDPTGFDDDIRVANAVFEEISRHELLIRP